MSSVSDATADKGRQFFEVVVRLPFKICGSFRKFPYMNEPWLVESKGAHCNGLSHDGLHSDRSAHCPQWQMLIPDIPPEKRNALQGSSTKRYVSRDCASHRLHKALYVAVRYSRERHKVALGVSLCVAIGCASDVDGDPQSQQCPDRLRPCGPLAFCQAEPPQVAAKEAVLSGRLRVRCEHLQRFCFRQASSPSVLGVAV